MNALKEQLYKLCSDYIAHREAAIKQNIADARDAAANDTKSSAGDKYETGREMMQQEIDLNMTRLNELKNLQVALDRINPGQEYTTAQPGALVHTTQARYYIAISAGQLKIGDDTYLAISAASPIGARLAGLKAGDSFVFNDKQIQISSVL